MIKENRIIMQSVVVILIIALTLVYIAHNKKNNKVTQKEDKQEEIVYIVSFDTDGGNKIQNLEFKEGEMVILPEEPTKEGFKFEGWYLSNERYQPSKIQSNIELKAKWISNDIATYTIVFNTDGGNKISNRIIEKGKPLRLPNEPEKKGYIFVKWVNEKGVEVKDKTIYNVGDTLVLKAVWKSIATMSNVNSNIVYECPKGYTVSRDKCIESLDATKYCPNGTFDYEDKCVVINNKLRLDKVDSCLENYAYIEYPVDYDGIDNLPSGCYPLVDKSLKCDPGYALVNGSCIKVIDAIKK